MSPEASFDSSLPSSRNFTPSVTDAEPYARVQVVRLGDLAYEDRGWTRGHAHIGFQGYPREAPGLLEFGALKLAALQTVDPGCGYPLHRHERIETVALVLDGVMLHEDDLGNRVPLRASDVGLLSAGTGMSHAEFAEASGPTRVLLFWIEPSELEAAPRFVHGAFPRRTRTNRLARLASGRPGAPPAALPLRRDVEVLLAFVEAGAAVLHRLQAGRRAYVVATDAAVLVNSEALAAGERALVTGPGVVEIVAERDTEVALVDLD